MLAIHSTVALAFLLAKQLFQSQNLLVVTRRKSPTIALAAPTTQNPW